MAENNHCSAEFQDMLNEMISIDVTLKQLMPYGFYYDVPGSKPQVSTDLIAEKDFVGYAKVLRMLNSNDFLRFINEKSANDLQKEFEVQFFFFKTKLNSLPPIKEKDELLKWLTFTKAIINRQGPRSVFGEGNRYVRYEFSKWYNAKIRSLEGALDHQPDFEERFYFPGVPKLAELYNNLLKHVPPLISENKFFMDSLQNEAVEESHKTVWLGERTQLMYLIGLLLRDTSSLQIPFIAFSLFKFPGGKTTAHSINVTYNQKYRPKHNTALYLESKQKAVTEVFNATFKIV